MFFYGIRKELEDKKINPILLLINDGKKFEFNLKRNTFRQVGAFISPTYLLKRKTPLTFEEIFSKRLKESSSFLSFDRTKFDLDLEECSIDSSFFNKATHRQKELQPIWIFRGDSFLGKSYLATFIASDKTIYETDISNILPSKLNYDVIVLGNKYKFSKEDLEERISNDREIIYVNFSKDWI